jgi:hypothetical protein
VIATRNERVAWELFCKCVTDTLGVVAAEDPAIYDHWFRFLEEVGKEKVRLLALAFEFEDRATWRPLWNVMFKWCVGEVRKQVSEENAAEHVTVDEMARFPPNGGLPMVDPKDPQDPKDLNTPAASDPQARRDKDEIAEDDLDKVSGGSTGGTHNGGQFPYL